jgi:AcrR family transcriptional regulator
MTPRKARAKDITIDAIVETALTLLDTEDVDSFSLRRVGQSMGTSHVMILRRCGSLDGLLDACAERIAADFPSVSDDHDWIAATQTRFEAAYEMWGEHANLLLLMRGRAWLGENMVSRFYEPTMREFLDAGMAAPAAAQVFSLLYRTTLGAVITRRANQWTEDESRRAWDQIGVDQVPTLARVELEFNGADSSALFHETLRHLLLDAARTLPAPVATP